MRKKLLERLRGEPPPTTKIGWDCSATFTLSVHGTNFSEAEVIVNTETFKPLADGEFLEIELCDECVPEAQRKFVVQFVKASLKDPGAKHIHISLIKRIADLLGINGRPRVRVGKLTSPEKYAIKSVGVSFKDTFFSRRDMGLLEKYLKENKQIIYENKIIEYEEQTFRIKNPKLRNSAIQSRTGIIDSKTKFRYYSRSCRSFWIIEISKELYEYDNEGYLLYERIIDFITKAFEQFGARGVTHKITFIAAGKLYFPYYNVKDGLDISIDKTGRLYHNFVHKIATVQSFKTSMLQTVLHLKKALAEYPAKLNWVHNKKPHVPSSNVEPFKKYEGVPLPPSELSDSKDFSILEALNVCYKELTLIGQESLDLTGKQVLVLTPGNGTYEVSEELANTTKHLFRNFDCNVDLFAFGYPPLHIVPLFYYYCYQSSCSSLPKIYKFPYWMNLYFIGSKELYGCATSRTDFTKKHSHTAQDIPCLVTEHSSYSEKHEASIETVFNVKHALLQVKPFFQKPLGFSGRPEKSALELHDELYFTTENFDMEMLETLTKAALKPNARRSSFTRPRNISAVKLQALAQDYPRERVKTGNLSTVNIEPSLKDSIKPPFNPFAPLLENDRHYKGYLYWCKSRGCNARNLERLFGKERTKAKEFNAFKYLCGIKLLPIETTDFVYSEEYGSSLKTIPAYRETKQTKSNHMEELLLQMLVESFQILSEDASERFIASQGLSKKSKCMTLDRRYYILLDDGANIQIKILLKKKDDLMNTPQKKPIPINYLLYDERFGWLEKCTILVEPFNAVQKETFEQYCDPYVLRPNALSVRFALYSSHDMSTESSKTYNEWKKENIENIKSLVETNFTTFQAHLTELLKKKTSPRKPGDLELKATVQDPYLATESKICDKVMRVELNKRVNGFVQYFDILYDSTVHPLRCFHIEGKWQLFNGVFLQNLIGSFLFKLKKEKTRMRRIPLLGLSKTSYPLHYASEWVLPAEDIEKFKDFILLPPLEFMLECKHGGMERYLDPAGKIITEITETISECIWTVSIIINPLPIEDPATISRIVASMVNYLKSINSNKK